MTTDTNFTNELSRSEVYTRIDSERAYQDQRWVDAGGRQHPHSIEEWAVYMEYYLNEMKRVMTKAPLGTAQPPFEAREALRKLTALGVAALEQHGCEMRHM